MQKDFFIYFVIVGAFMISSFSFADDPNNVSEMLKKQNPGVELNLQERGKLLRQAIEEKYRELISTHTYSYNPLKGKGNDISAIVLSYIPKGTSFDDAEAVLRAAGINVGPRPDINVSGNLPFKHDVVAGLDGFASNFACKTNLTIFLMPEAPGKYSKVKNIDAGFVTTCL